MSTTNASLDEAEGEKCSLASVKRSKVAIENLKADTKLKELKTDSKSDESSVNSDVSGRNDRKRGPCPWQVDPPPQPFKKARHASEIKNYEHTVSRMKLSLGVERERLQAQSTLNPSSNISSSYNNEYSTHSSIPSYANIYNNASSNYNANLYNPLLRWSRLAGNNDNLPVNRVLQSILFSGNEQQNTEVHPLLMLSLAESNNSEENAPCEMSVNNFNCGLMSNMTGAHGGTTPIGMHSPPTSEYDSSSDEASLGDDFIHDQSFMQQQLQYQQLQHYQQLNNQQQNLNELMNQSNANAAVNFCKKLQQIQQNNPNMHENAYLFQNALMNCGGLEGFQNRQLLNLHLQSLCEKVQAQRNLMPLSTYPNFSNLNQTHTPDFADDNSSVGGLDSFRRNTPSETGSELTLTAVPLVSNSSGLTEETRCDSRSSAGQIDNIKKVTESRLKQDISEESDTDLSLSEDSCSEIGVAEASDSSEQEEEREMSSLKSKKDSGGVLTSVDNREKVEATATEEAKESDYSVRQNKGDESESLGTSPCSAASHESGEAQLTTVLTCNCVIAKEQSSPSSVSSTKSIEESLPSSSPPVSDCQDCSFKASADDDKDRHGKTSDNYFFDQPFHISMKQNIGFQKA